MRLLDSARKGDVVIVWKLDRLARSLRQLIDTTVRGASAIAAQRNFSISTMT
jgi:hypothetical protein